MSSAKLVAAAGAAALALSGCGGVMANPVAGSPDVAKGRGKVDNPVTNMPNHLACLRQAGLTVNAVVVNGSPGLQIGTPPAGPTVFFTPTAGAAQELQIGGSPRYQGAEVIGSALLYPHQGSDAELGTIETCLAKGVAG
jgi:hypothetical protein